MNRISVGILGIMALVLAASAFGNSMPSLLEYSETQSGVGGAAKVNSLKSVRVLVDGTVEAFLEGEEVARFQLGGERLDRLTKEVRGAETSDLKTVRPGVLCAVASPTIDVITGNGGVVTIYSGHSCNGPVLMNSSGATESIRRMVSNLKYLAFRE